MSNARTDMSERHRRPDADEPADLTVDRRIAAVQRRELPVPIRRVWPEDAGAVTALVAQVWHPLPLSAWLVPDPARRYGILAEVAGLYVEHALAEGQVWATADLAAVAVWMPADPGEPSLPYHHAERLAAVCGETVGRFVALAAARAAAEHGRPHHQHLAALAVRRDRQQHGLAEQLLAHHLHILDSAGVPACAIATDEVCRAWCHRVGFTDHLPPITVPGSGGSMLWPLWRAAPIDSPLLPAPAEPLLGCRAVAAAGRHR